jgi:hypothetical protein
MRALARIASRHCGDFFGEARMPKLDKSVAILTGMIFAAIYVILLIGFSRESYVLRATPDPVQTRFRLAAAESKAAAPASRPDQGCAVAEPICAVLYADAGGRRTCEGSIEALRQLLALRPDRLTQEALTRALDMPPN